MKKLLSIALCAAVVSAFAESTEVELGEVGVTAITTSLSNAIVAVSYDDLADDKGGMVYSNLVKTTNLTVNDKLIQFSYDESGAGKYTSWVLKEGTTSGGAKYKYWEGQPEAYKDDSGSDQLKISPAPDTVRGAVGSGIWLVRQNPIDVNGSTNSFYIYGKPAANTTSATVAGKWTLIGNPTQRTVQITADLFGSSELTEGDEIVVPLPPSGNLSRYTYSAQRRIWRTTDADGKWVNTPPALDAGLGCWIRTEKPASINWISE